MILLDLLQTPNILIHFVTRAVGTSSSEKMRTDGERMGTDQKCTLRAGQFVARTPSAIISISMISLYSHIGIFSKALNKKKI
jgi:hypothetical protein